MHLPADEPRNTTAPVTRRGGHPRSRRSPAPRRAFTHTLRALENLAGTGAKVSVHVSDLDRDLVVFSGDDFVPYPIADLGTVAVLLETAAQLHERRIDAAERFEHADVVPPAVGGVWGHMRTSTLTLGDLAVLTAAVGDPAATNALLRRVGLSAVRQRLDSLGFTQLAVLDSHRIARGLDDAPHVAVGTTRELASLMTMIVNGVAVDPAVSAQVGEWLTLNSDLSLVASATGLDPFRHEDDRHGLLFLNKTGRDDGVRAEAGVIAGPRAGIAYAITICFDDLSVGHRLRVNEALRTFGVDLMEYVY